MGLTTPVRVVVTGAGAAIDRVDRILSAVEVLAASIGRIEQDMRGMRSDLREAIDGINRLRDSVGALDGSVLGIRDATVSLDDRVVELQDSLVHVDALVQSLPRVKRRVARARQNGATAAAPVETAL